MNKLTKELNDTIRIFVNELHTIVINCDGYNQISIAKKGYPGSFLIIKNNSMWFNGVEYPITDKNILRIEEHVKMFYSVFWQKEKINFC